MDTSFGVFANFLLDTRNGVNILLKLKRMNQIHVNQKYQKERVMRFVSLVKRIITLMMVMSTVSACQSTKSQGTALNQLKPASSDEQAIYKSLSDLKDNISNSKWDQWLALYTDDAVLTKGGSKVSKEEMRKAVEGISYEITSMKVLSKEIGVDQAKISVQFLGNGKKQFETYHFKKINNRWLIIMETNP